MSAVVADVGWRGESPRSFDLGFCGSGLAGCGQGLAAGTLVRGSGRHWQAGQGAAQATLLVEAGDRVVWAELAAAVGTSAVAVGLVFGEGGQRMPLAEDQHPVGDFPADGEDEAFREGVRAGFAVGSSPPGYQC